MNSTNSLKKKCAKCNIKVGICGIDCRCGSHFCIKHLSPFEHLCAYDDKKERLKKLELDNPKIIAPKLSVI